MMRMSSNLTRNAAALAGLGLVASPLLALIAPALAAADPCTQYDAAATEVLTGVCELQYVETGDFTFTAPSGVAKLSAIVVGAGGGTMYDNGTYTGGGGAVVYVANVDTAAAVAITVGQLTHPSRKAAAQLSTLTLLRADSRAITSVSARAVAVKAETDTWGRPTPLVTWERALVPAEALPTKLRALALRHHPLRMTRRCGQLSTASLSMVKVGNSPQRVSVRLDGAVADPAHATSATMALSFFAGP